MQLRHMQENGLSWDDQYHSNLAMKMFDKIYNLKFLPPGRGLWAMGTKLIDEK